MIVDFLAEALPSLEYDLCVIGGGAAGISLTREFAGSRYKLLLLESGGLGPEPETQALYDSEVVGTAHGGIHGARVRAYGGTTSLWGGQSLRFESVDFQARPWLPNSGWPLRPEVLDPYYERAEAVLQVGEKLTYEELCRRLGFRPPSFDLHKFRLTVSQWSRCPNFATAYGRQLQSATNVIVALHANVSRLLASENDGTITAVEIKSLSGKTERIKARFYVVCCGAIETARLLLNSDRPNQRGVGNQYDLVGRYFMDHIHADLGLLRAVDRKLLHDAFESFVVHGRLYSPKLVLTEEQQARAGLLRILGEVIMEDPADSPISLCKHLYKAVKDRAVPVHAKGRLAGSAMRSALAEPLEITRTAWRLYVRGRGAKATYSKVRLGVQCENAPCFESSVSLSDSRDCLGMRRSRLNWVVGELERATLKAFAKLFAKEIDRLGYAEYKYDAPVAAILNDADGWKDLIHDGAHQMGTARMSESPREGVVDPSCRVHGVDNLYIGSSAVFPTGGPSSPTLTIIALCIRIADTIKECLKGREDPL